MTDLTSTFTAPPKGHNNPPSDIETLSEKLALAHITLIRDAEAHIGFARDIPATFGQKEEADFASDYIKLVQKCQKELEKNRKAEKEPFLRQGQFVDEFFKVIIDKLEIAASAAKRPLNDYLQRMAAEEKARREAEAEMLAREHKDAMQTAAETAAPEAVDHAVTMTQVARAADAIAKEPVVSMASAQGLGSITNLKLDYNGIITDAGRLDIEKLRPFFTLPELQKALDRFVKQGGRALEGAVIVESVGVKVK